jgi:hypothetical protein
MTVRPSAAARKLQRAAARSLPLFARIACDAAYAAGLARAVKAKRYDLAERKIRRVLPKAEISLGAGFSVVYTVNGTLLEIGIFRPGRRVAARELQLVARTMLPLLKTIAANRCFARRLAAWYRLKKPGKLLRLARAVVPASRAVAAGVDRYGFHFAVRVPGGAGYRFLINLRD